MPTVLDAYMASHGDYVMTPSRHSVVAGGVRSVELRRQITIVRDPTDLALEGYFQDLDLQVVLPNVPAGTHMKPGRWARLMTDSEGNGEPGLQFERASVALRHQSYFTNGRICAHLAVFFISNCM